jgi:hypothetical protein
MTVDEFVLQKPPTSTDPNSFQRAACNSFNINQLETANFNSFQYELESGSGPGGRRFKSSLPDHLFSATYSRLEKIKTDPLGLGPGALASGCA